MRRTALRRFIGNHKFSSERVRFAYVFKDKQAAFVQALVDGTESEEVDRASEANLAIVWRRDSNSVKYEWLSQTWEGDLGNENQTSELRTSLQRLLSANEVLANEAEVLELFDEHATSMFVAVSSKMIEVVEAIRENISVDEILPSVSLVATVIFILIGGYIMSYLVKMEEESVQRQLGAKGLKVRLHICAMRHASTHIFCN